VDGDESLRSGPQQEYSIGNLDIRNTYYTSRRQDFIIISWFYVEKLADRSINPLSQRTVNRILSAIESTDENIGVAKCHIKYPNCASKQLNGLALLYEAGSARCRKVLADSTFYHLWLR
jgi:hypothetical protein